MEKRMKPGMSDTEALHAAAEIPIYDAVCDLDDATLERTVRDNARARNFPLTEAHLDVIRTLVAHYRADCQNRDCLGASEHMRFLQDAYEQQGGSKYLTMLFDAMPDTRGVLLPIHRLAGLPMLQQDTDQGFGTAM
jgi:hypothetical protein